MAKSMYSPDRSLFKFRSPFAVITSTSLGRLYTTFWIAAVWICVYSATRVLLRSGSCKAMRPEAQSLFQLISKLFSGIEVIQSSLGKPCLSVVRLTGVVLLEQVWAT